MKFAIILSFQVLTTSLIAQKTALDSCKRYIEKDLAKWAASFPAFDFADFQKSETVQFENNYPQSFKKLKSFYSVYKPLVTFSKDSSKFIDIYSYQLNLEKKGNVFEANIEVDQAILLCDLKTKHWNRIFFGSTDRWIDDAMFVTNSRFILVGIVKNDKNERLPIILLGDVNKQTLEIFTTTNKSCVQLGNGYESPHLKRIHIIGL